MKRFFALLLALVMCLSLCACNTTSSSTTTSNTTTSDSNTDSTSNQPKEKPVLLDSTAESLASGYMSSWISKIESEARKYNDEIESVSFVNIGSVSADESYSNDNENNYIITAKGTFYGEDAYGDLIKKYKFTWTVNIDYSSSGNSWLTYKWTNNNIVISE